METAVLTDDDDIFAKLTFYLLTVIDMKIRLEKSSDPLFDSAGFTRNVMNGAEQATWRG